MLELTDTEQRMADKLTDAGCLQHEAEDWVRIVAASRLQEVPEWEPPDLREIVKSINFMPYWQAYLGKDNEGGGWLTFHIVSYTPNSYDPSRNISVNHSFLVPMATWNERTWKMWIRDCYEKVWRHEIGEFLQFDGVREFAPHHGNGEDPYTVWHIGDLKDTQVKAGEFKCDCSCLCEGKTHHWASCENYPKD